MSMQCKEVYRFICDNLDQGSDSPECAAIRLHLDSCADCRAYLETLKQTVHLYQSAPSPRVPQAVHRRLMAVLEECMTGRPRRAGHAGRGH